MNKHIKNYICIRKCFIEDDIGKKIYDYEEMLEEFNIKFNWLNKLKSKRRKNE